MKMNKKGFTLIELLAVIVILAVIALIASPIIMGIISDAQESARIRSVEAYVKAIESTASTYMTVDPSVSTPIICAGEQKRSEVACHIDATKAANEDANHEGAGVDGMVVKFVKYSGSTVVCDSATYANGVVSVTNCTVGSDATKYSGNVKEGIKKVVTSN